MISYRAKKAFTLVELLIVIIIIGVIAGGLWLAMGPSDASAKKAACLGKGSGELRRTTVGKLSWYQCREIGREKMADLNAADEVAAARIIAGTARSMGVTVEGAPN